MDRACAAESEYDRLQPEAMRRQATCWTAVPQAPLPERLPALRRARGGPGSPYSKRALSCTPQPCGRTVPHSRRRGLADSSAQPVAMGARRTARRAMESLSQRGEAQSLRNGRHLLCQGVTPAWAAPIHSEGSYAARRSRAPQSGALRVRNRTCSAGGRSGGHAGRRSRHSNRG